MQTELNLADVALTLCFVSVANYAEVLQ